MEDLLALHSSCPGLPIALDETLDDIIREESQACGTSMPIQLRSLLHNHGVAALVVKPSVVGGFERACTIARWAHGAGLQVRELGIMLWHVAESYARPQTYQ